MAYQNFILGTWNRKVLRYHLQYGPIVRVAPDRLGIDANMAWAPVFGLKSGSHEEFYKDPASQKAAKTAVDNIVQARRDDHRRQRRLLSHAFSEAAMYKQEPIITDYVDQLVGRLRERTGVATPIDLISWINFTTFDIIGDLTFGDPFGCLRESNLHPWVAAIFSNLKALALTRFFSQYPILGHVITVGVDKSCLKKRDETKDLAFAKMRKRLALGVEGNGRRDFTSYILAHNDKQGMSEMEILENGRAMITAGSETVGTALAGLVFYLTTNHAKMERLTREIRDTFKSEDQINMRSTAQLPYLNACLEEALRIFPPLAETPPRVSPGDYVQDVLIPRGTLISVYQWASYHNPGNFVQPDDFIPERWLPKSHPLYDHKYDGDNLGCVKAFSFGPRNCIGKNLAYSEMRVIMSRLLWNFDITLVKGYERWPYDLRVFSVWDKTPLMVTLENIRDISTD